jgi:hypothetical protein
VESPGAPVMCLAVAIRGFERRLERMVEGAFARAFRSSIRPVELARRLAREMDDHVSIGVRGTPVAANHYTIFLSPGDYQEFGEVRDALRRELCDAARAHARDEQYGFMGPVDVELVVDDSFGTGWFEVEGRFREGAGRGRSRQPGTTHRRAVHPGRACHQHRTPARVQHRPGRPERQPQPRRDPPAG